MNAKIYAASLVALFTIFWCLKGEIKVALHSCVMALLLLARTDKNVLAFKQYKAKGVLPPSEINLKITTGAIVVIRRVTGNLG